MASTDIFKQISMTVSEAGKTGLEKAKELRDTAKISMEIRDRETSIQKAYRELGKAYYMNHRNDEDPDYDQVVYIKAVFEEIGELKANKDEVRGIRRCSECGEAIPNGASFCPNCGKKYVAPDTEAKDAAGEAERDAGETAEDIVDYAEEMAEDVIDDAEEIFEDAADAEEESL